MWCEDKNPYEILGLPRGPDTPEQEIRKAYRTLALRQHPDKNPEADPAAFLLLNKAYELLSDKDARLAFDDLLRAKAQREERLSHHSEKRRRMMEELEVKERQAAEERTEEERARERLKVELQRLRKKMEDEQIAKQQQRQQQQVQQQQQQDTKEWRSTGEPAGGRGRRGCHSHVPELSQIVKVTWNRGKQDETEQTLRELFSAFGPVTAVVMREALATKSKKKRKQTNSALVVLANSELAAKAADALKEGTDLESVILMQKVGTRHPHDVLL
ncbi:unnamed protein product [Ostreobium quekettii]|uniref:J domain-containing protein n=1 Tax=Ostreobium quekettii TaxID=121088 RepID=A0A8S1JBG6_9CHLO|nr:unnamed protein product [Ostreobium quekettii]